MRKTRVSITEIAEIFGVPWTEVARWFNAGCCAVESQKRSEWRLAAVFDWWKENIMPTMIVRDGHVREDNANKLEAAKVRFLELKTEEQQIKVDILKGKLIPRDEIDEAAILTVIQGFKDSTVQLAKLINSIDPTFHLTSAEDDVK